MLRLGGIEIYVWCYVILFTALLIIKHLKNVNFISELYKME